MKRFSIVVLLGLGLIHSVAATEVPSDFQEDLYRRYILKGNKTINAWQDFIGQASGIRAAEGQQELIISLTSYPARIKTTWLAVETLLRQETKPTRVVLNLFEGEFPDHQLPSPFAYQIQRGLEVNWCPENLKVFLKVIPTIQRFPEDLVVAVDDDIIYPSQLLTDLMDGHRQYPDCVVARDVRKIAIRDKKILPVLYWKITGWTSSDYLIPPSYDLIPEGVFGILFPPHCLHEDLTKKDLYFKLCPTDDDAWLYTMAIIKGTKVVKVPHKIGIKFQASSFNKDALSETNLQHGCAPLNETFKRLFWVYNLEKILEVEEVLIRLKSSRDIIQFGPQFISYIPFILRQIPLTELLKHAYNFIK